MRSEPWPPNGCEERKADEQRERRRAEEWLDRGKKKKIK